MLRFFIFIYIIFVFIVSSSFGALPPTSSKLSGETDYSTTFRFSFPHFAGTHNGTEVNLGILAPSGGGTGLNTLGPANSVLGVNAAGLASEYKTITPTANQVNVTHGVGTITLSTPQDIATTSSPTFANETISGDITLSNAAFDSEKVGDTLAMHSSTGVRSGAAMTINGGDPTKFDIASGVGYIVNYATPSAPTIDRIAIGPFTAQTVTNLASADFTWVMINSAGAIVQQAAVPTAQQRRDNIVIGRLNHSNRTNISFANTLPDFQFSVGSQLGDLMDSLGSFNISGNVITANGSNLSINKSAGVMFQKSFNYTTNTKNPHEVSTPGITLVNFAYQNQSGGPGANVTVLDPTNYDVGGTTTAVPGGPIAATVQRVYLFGSNTLRIQRGQAVYSNLAAAVSGFANEPFVVSPLVEGFAVIVAYVAVEKGCLDLSTNTCSRIIPAGKFGSTATGGGGTTTLQQAYLNSVQPQIILNSTQLGMQIRDASTPIGATLFAIQDNAGTTNYLGVSAAAGLGTIGVNVSSPSATAHLHNTGAAANSLKVTNSVTGTGASDGVNVGVTATGEAQVYNFENTALNFATNNTQRAQISAGGSMAIGASAPTTSAKLDIQGTDGALLLPRLSTTQKNALTPTAGMQVYDSTIGNVSTYNGAWVSPLTNPMTTGGDTIYGGSGGTPTRLPNGTANQLLSSTGGTSAPAWTSLSSIPSSVTFSTTVSTGGAGGNNSLDYGTASVAVANVSNAASITTPASCTYMRVGDIVNASCGVSVGCTTASNTFTQFTVVPPVATTNATSIRGTFGSNTSGETGRVISSGSNMLVEFYCQNTGATTKIIEVTYKTQ